MRLSQKSIEFARNHIHYFGDSDFFVIPFEFLALWQNWDEVGNYLLSQEISKKGIERFRVKPPMTSVAHKPGGGYRVVHQLDPLDSLLYTALAHEVAEAVERCRPSVEHHIACSYRISISQKGNFLAQDTGWDNFTKRCEKLASDYSWVLIADITDFYNQIYVHRLQNNIEQCGSALHDVSNAIEEFLLSLNMRISKGIPVGPGASIVMAEASLIDVDEFILERTANYTRYVDDIRVFSHDRLELETILHDLTQYLYSAHRLNLSSAKTKVIESKTFIESELRNPEMTEKEAIQKALKDLNIDYDNGYPSYEPPTDIESLPSENRIKVVGTALRDLLVEIAARDVLDLGLARHILRRAKQLRSRAIIIPLLERFDYFAPVIRDLVLYLEKVTTKSMVEQLHEVFTKVLLESDAIKFPYVRYWMKDYFRRYPSFANYNKIREFMYQEDGIRSRALLAAETKQVSWVRSNRSLFSTIGPWDKRALIYSAIALSHSERNRWMDSILQSNSSDIIDRSLAKFVKSR